MAGFDYSDFKFYKFTRVGRLNFGYFAGLTALAGNVGFGLKFKFTLALAVCLRLKFDVKFGFSKFELFMFDQIYSAISFKFADIKTANFKLI